MIDKLVQLDQDLIEIGLQPEDYLAELLEVEVHGNTACSLIS